MKMLIKKETDTFDYEKQSSEIQKNLFINSNSYYIAIINQYHAVYMAAMCILLSHVYRYNNA